MLKMEAALALHKPNERTRVSKQVTQRLIIGTPYPTKLKLIEVLSNSGKILTKDDFILTVI